MINGQYKKNTIEETNQLKEKQTNNNKTKKTLLKLRNIEAMQWKCEEK